MSRDFGSGAREVRSWEPMALKDCRKLATGGAMFLDFLRVFLLLGCFVGSVFFVGEVLKRPPSLLRDPVWYGVLIAFVAIAFSTLRFALLRSHARRRLVMFDKGIQFGSSFVAFQDIERISKGQFKTLMEKYFPSLEKAAVIANEPLHAKSTMQSAGVARQLIRDSSVTIDRKAGQQIHWVGLLTYFSEKHLLEFFQMIRERAPHIQLPELPSLSTR